MNEMTRISAQPAYSEGVQALLKRKPQLFIGGEWVDSSHGKTIPVYDPSTGREIARIVDASDADVRPRRRGRPRRLRRRPLVGPALGQARAGRSCARRPDRGQSRRAGRAGIDRQRQADDGLGRLRPAEMRRGAALHGRLGDQDFGRAYRAVRFPDRHGPRLCPARAGRRLRADRAVELPADDGGAEDRAGARRRLHDRAEARRADAADRASPRRSGRRGGHPRPACST